MARKDQEKDKLDFTAAFDASQKLTYQTAQIIQREGLLISSYSDGDKRAQRGRSTLVKYSRHMMQNSPIWQAIINYLVTTTLGADGAEIVCNDKSIQAEIDNIWRGICLRIDSTKRFCETEFTRLVLTEYLNVGEVLLMKDRATRSLKVIETERILKVNFDPSTGQYISFEIKNDGEVVILPALDCIYLSRILQPSQYRGMGILWGASGSYIAMCDCLLSNSAKSAAEANKLAVIVTKANFEQMLVKQEEDSDFDPEENTIQTDAGTYLIGGPGDNIAAVDTSKQPNPNLYNCLLAYLRYICAPIGIDAAQLLNDFGAYSYSSSKSSIIALERTVSSLQTMMKYSYHKPIANWLIGAEISAGSIKRPFDEIADAIDFQYPKLKSNDPAKDLQAAKMALDLGVTTVSAEARKVNLDPEQLIAERKGDLIRAAKIAQEIETESGGVIPAATAIQLLTGIKA